MSARKSSILLENTVGQTNVIGQQTKGSAYYNLAGGNHTIAVYNTNFTGRLYIEASLASHPTESDWVNIEYNPLSSFIYTEYTASTGVFTFNFQGNYIWLRAKIDRTYLATPSDPAHGSIAKILLNV